MTRGGNVCKVLSRGRVSLIHMYHFYVPPGRCSAAAGSVRNVRVALLAGTAQSPPPSTSVAPPRRAVRALTTPGRGRRLDPHGGER